MNSPNINPQWMQKEEIKVSPIPSMTTTTK